MNEAIDLMESAIKHGFAELPDAWVHSIEESLVADGRKVRDVRALYVTILELRHVR